MNRPRLPLRHIVAIASIAAAAAVLAQNAPPPPMPPKLEPLPEIPPATAPGIAGDPELEPQVTITRKESETVEEARVNGKIVWVKVTPRHGRPYFLVPDGSGNIYIRRDSLETGLRVPLWLLLEF